MQIQSILSLNSSGEVTESTEVSIPDGKWVIKATVGNSHSPIVEDHGFLDELIEYDAISFFNVKPSDIAIYTTKVRREVHPHNRDYITWPANILLVADRPFGVIWHGGIRSASELDVSRKIRDGSLGNKPRVRTPKFTRGVMGKSSRRCVQLTKLAKFIGLTPTQLCREFHDFYPDDSIASSDYLSLLFAEKRTSSASITNGTLLSAWEDYEGADDDSIWIPAKWAMTILYLLHFGYKYQRISV